MIREKITNAPPITGISPFNELAIDAEIWRQAHDHHNRHRLLHAITSHRPGIVYGLEVIAKQDRTIIVAPGIACDPEGRVIALQEPVTFSMEEKGQFFVLLTYKQPFISETAVSIGGGEKHYGFIEGREVKITKDLPASDFIELARVFRSNPEAPVKDAADPFDPAHDEINLLHRKQAFPQCYADITVGELSYVPASEGGKPADWKPNRAGLCNLLMEGNGRGFHLDFAGPVNITQESATHPTLLYIAGKHAFRALSQAQIDGLRRFLSAGGSLFGDSCGGEDFAKSFEELATQLGAKLKKADRKHPILKAHYVFSSPPSGAAGDGALSTDDEAGIILSRCNYGGAWQGDVDKPEAADARERIRQSMEFGLNIIAYAAKRHRARQLASLI